MTSDPELDAFKRQINLVQFATGRGYILRARESSRSSKVLVHPETGDKIIVARQVRDDHWVYFSVRDSRDHGSVIDFVQNRGSSNLGRTRVELRRWLNNPTEFLARHEARVEPSAPDVPRVTAAYLSARHGSNSEYLNARGLRPETLQNPKFAHTWRIDLRSNVLFGHHDAEGLTGFEIKNAGFTGFAAGGRKSLWRSAPGESDDRLVVVESAINALSYHQLHSDERVRYVSTAGTPSALQLDLLTREVQAMAGRTEVIAATDNDAEGTRFAGEIERMTQQSGVAFRRHTPAQVNDWNDVLRSVEGEFIQTIREKQPATSKKSE